MKTTIQLIFVFILCANLSMASSRLCEVNSRHQVHDSRIGRVRQNSKTQNPCTLFLIGRQCALSAGHCQFNFNLAEFNVPNSEHSLLKRSKLKDIYFVEKFQAKSNGLGEDWAVVKLKPNILTGMYPGDALGYFNIQSGSPSSGMIKVIGYSENKNEEFNYTLQESLGKLSTSINQFSKAIYYNAFTRLGNSGSPIIDLISGNVMGIHTHGGCLVDGYNKGTEILKNQELINQINSCLQGSF